MSTRIGNEIIQNCTQHECLHDQENIFNINEENSVQIITHKFALLRKERDKLKKENKELQQEVINLQNNIKDMIPGFSNTSSSFPMYNEMLNKISELMKCDSNDIFFDVLSSREDLNFVSDFYKTIFIRLHSFIQYYFDEMIQIMCKVLCIDQLFGPLNTILKKSLQANFQMVFEKCFSKDVVLRESNQICDRFKIEEKHLVCKYIMKVSEIFLYSFMFDPPFEYILDSIGVIDKYNGLAHDSLDGFIKNKSDCLIVLPFVYKTNGELVCKATVLPLDYQFI